MFIVLKFALIGLLILFSADGLETENVVENIKVNESVLKENALKENSSVNVAAAPVSLLDAKEIESKPVVMNEKLKLEQMPLVIDEQEGVVKEIAQTSVEIPKKFKEEEVEPLPLKENGNSPPSVNRTSRQLFYSPNFFYIQNIGAEGSGCLTSRGLVGICMGFNRCSQEQNRRRRQLAFYNLAELPQFVPYVQPIQQQEELCTFFDQYARTNSGVCCTSIDNISPMMPAEQPSPANKPEYESPEEGISEEPTMGGIGAMKPVDIHKEMETSEDSDVLELPANFDYQPAEPATEVNTNNEEANHIDYDPVDENLKQAQDFNNFIRYPWPSQFVGFSGVQQWPPPLPTHPPSVGSWPPPLPTHPPNHHYPTHPPSSTGGQYTTTRRPVTSLTTKRPTYPSYPSYPTYRPTTTTTTTKKPTISADGGVSTTTGLPLQCGMKNVVTPDQERIVGGMNASPNEFPWIAVLFKSGKQFCGGSLITNNHILTAAHCVARMTSWDVAALTVHLGDYNIRTDFEVQHVSRRIKRLVRHKGFDFSTLHNDIAILTLSEPVKYSHEIQPICLPTSTSQQTRSYSGHVATVAGWGSLRENGPQPSILQKVQIPIWTNSECAQKYGRAAPAGIIESMVCAGQASKDSCSGDSGGPMIVNESGRYVQVGIVSWGIGCGKGQYPGVYTRVTSLLPWIYKNIK